MELAARSERSELMASECSFTTISLFIFCFSNSVLIFIKYSIYLNSIYLNRVNKLKSIPRRQLYVQS